eukprot:COSAG02_NODE_5916_length_3941_cov_2.224362_2_plen_37_part_00
MANTTRWWLWQEKRREDPEWYDRTVSELGWRPDLEE